LHLHPPGAGGKSGAHPHAPGFHSRQIVAHMLGKVQLFVLGEGMIGVPEAFVAESRV
jgi:hypothetical protein